ncbi:ArsR/SmtB family transcription factor [Desulfobacterota bacterium M19]
MYMKDDMKDEDVEHVAALLKTMSHPIRMRILCLLQDKEMTVGDLRAEVMTSNANVSQHLTILRNKQIIASRKEANYIYNRIADKRILELISTMKNLFCPAE